MLGLSITDTTTNIRQLHFRSLCRGKNPFLWNKTLFNHTVHKYKPIMIEHTHSQRCWIVSLKKTKEKSHMSKRSIDTFCWVQAKGISDSLALLSVPLWSAFHAKKPCSVRPCWLHLHVLLFWWLNHSSSEGHQIFTATPMDSLINNRSKASSVFSCGQKQTRKREKGHQEFSIHDIHSWRIQRHEINFQDSD